MDDLAKFLAAMFTLSIGVERIVEILKNFWDSVTGGKPLKSSPKRAGALQTIAAIIGTGLVLFIGPELLVPNVPLDETKRIAISVVLGAMASGGSKFWNDLISIVAAMKTVRESTAAVAAETKKQLEAQATKP